MPSGPGHRHSAGIEATDTLLLVANGTGATVYDRATGELVARFSPGLGDQPGVNDIALTPNGDAYPDRPHGVGRRDAPITDADREALKWVRNQPRGLSRAHMGTAQKAAFDELLEAFVLRLKPEQVGREMDRIRTAGQDGLHFVWAGSHRIEEPHYFRLEGPVTLVEFDNTEDDANHVHCVWRDPTNDFGVDILAQHRAAQHQGPASSTHDA